MSSLPDPIADVPHSPTEDGLWIEWRRDELRAVVLRALDLEGGQAWTAHLAVIANATLFGRRTHRLQRCAAAGYEGVVVG